MNNNVYKIALLIVGFVLFAAALYVNSPVQNKVTRITVVGDAQTKIAPDTAVITFSVVTQNNQALIAQQDNARKSEAVKKAVEAIAASAKPEIKTSDYSLNPEQDYSSDRMPKIIGYAVKNTVIVSINEITQIGSVVDAATKVGANSIEGIQFVLRENSLAQGDALALATRQAMTKAEAIAQSLNGRIVRVVESIEGGAPIVPERDNYGSSNSAMSMNMSVAKPIINTPVQAGSLNVRSQVVLVVEVQVNK